MEQRNSRLFLLLIYLALAVYLLPMFPHGGSANELTRWATAASLVEKNSFEISWTEPLIGKNVDTARVGDNVYSNKPPGGALLAAPVYAMTRIFTGPPDASNIRISWFLMRFFISTLPLFFLAVWLYQKDVDIFSLAALLFATPLFLYSFLFFSHVLVAVLIYLVFRLLYDAKYPALRNIFLGGFFAGFAVLCEFPAAIPVLLFGLGLFFTDPRDRFRRLFFYILGGLPMAVLLMIYNNALFGSPFSMSYGHESFAEWAEVAGQGFFGIGLPTLSNIYLLLVSPARGLFFFSPILLLSIIAFFTSREQGTLRKRVKITTILVSILILCGHGAAHGGWAFGARYLVFILPLMLDSFFDGEAEEFPSLWRGFLFGISFLLCTVPVLTFPFAPPEFRFPHNNFWLPFLTREGWFTPNLLNVFGLPNNIWTTLPAIALLLLAIYLIWRNAKYPLISMIGLLSAFLAVGVYFFVPGLDNDEARLRRATIAERFYKPAGRLEQFRSGAGEDWQFRRRINDFEWNIADSLGNAPNEFPYLETRAERLPGPTAKLSQVEDLQKQGKTAEAETLLRRGKEEFPFAQCDFASNLAVIYYTTGRKDLALQELESIQPLVNKASRPLCLRSQFLLGSLYNELGRTGEAGAALRRFLANTENSEDPEIKAFRQKAASMLRP
ncbi:MAG: hypothetical protein R2747_14970 [Pyrinomonadaceae bacterium]